jgi:hypothetical protein
MKYAIDGLRCHDTHTRLHTDTVTHRQQGDLISLLLFFKIKESRPKSEQIHFRTGLSHFVH